LAANVIRRRSLFAAGAATLALGGAGVSAQSYSAYISSLSAEDAVPPTTAEAGGSAFLYLNAEATTLRWSLATQLPDVTRVTLNVGARGVNGPELLTLWRGPLDTGGDSAEVWPELLAALDSGDTYIVVLTERFPEGAIRGQVSAFRVAMQPRN
jgi:hypothetical protein